MQLKTIQDYDRFIVEIKKYEGANKRELIRYLLRTDLYFLMLVGLGRVDIRHPWLLARCKEVQDNPNGRLDLWAREHYKSSVNTYAKTIQDILASHGNDPLPEWGGKEPVFAIFSHTRAIAKGFLRQIKREFEGNGLLKEYFPDVLWADPKGQAPKWSDDDGLIVIRKNNPKESTLEAWGLVDGQPTSKHYDVMIYDDVVTLESVRSPEMLRKTLESWEMSINLGAGDVKRRYIGTRYHFNDTYRDMMARNAAIPRIHPATIDGTPEGEPVLKTKEKIEELRRLLGPYTFATQQLLNPLADEVQGLTREWMRFYNTVDHTSLNRYILVDPASEKKKTSDYTAMFVIGLGEDGNYYILDIIRDRLNLKERADALFMLHRTWRPLNVGYEKYGMQADIEYIKERMERENYRFNIVELGGQIPKIDRIKRLIPDLSEGRWYYPYSMFKTDYEGKVQNLIDIYIHEEYLSFPVPVHDDMLDCQSRIMDKDLNILFPRMDTNDAYLRYNRKRSASPWAS